MLLIYNEEELSTNQGKEWRAVRRNAWTRRSTAHAGRCLRIGLVASLPGPRAYRRHGRAAGLTNIRIIQRIERLTDAFRKAIPGREPQQPLPEYIPRSLVFRPSCTTRTAFRTNRWRPSWKTGPGLRRSVGQHAASATPPRWPCDAGVTSDTELLSLLSDFVRHHPLDAARVTARMQARDERALHATAQMAALDYGTARSTTRTPPTRPSLRTRPGRARTAGKPGPQMASTIIRDLERRGRPGLGVAHGRGLGSALAQGFEGMCRKASCSGLAAPSRAGDPEVNESRRPMQTVMDAIEQIEADPPSASEALMPFLQNISSVQLRKAIESYAFDELKRFPDVLQRTPARNGSRPRPLQTGMEQVQERRQRHHRGEPQASFVGHPAAPYPHARPGLRARSGRTQRLARTGRPVAHGSA